MMTMPEWERQCHRLKREQLRAVRLAVSCLGDAMGMAKRSEMAVSNLVYAAFEQPLIGEPATNDQHQFRQRLGVTLYRIAGKPPLPWMREEG